MPREPTRKSSNNFFFFLNDRAPTEFYPLPLHDALPISMHVYWGLGLWLAAGEPRSCKVDEYQSPEREEATLARLPLRARAILTTVGILGPAGIAMLTEIGRAHV